MKLFELSGYLYDERITIRFYYRTVFYMKKYAVVKNNREMKGLTTKNCKEFSGTWFKNTKLKLGTAI